MSTWQNYNIKYSSIDQFYAMVCQKINGWYEQLQAVESSLLRFVEMEDFQGEAATAVKTYIQEVHGILLLSIRQTLAEYQTRVLLYRDGYYGLEPNIYACMPRENIGNIKDRMSGECQQVTGHYDSIGGILGGISDLLSLGNPSVDDLLITMRTVQNKLLYYDNDILGYEESFRNDAGDVRELIDTLQNVVEEYYNGGREITGYRSGDCARIGGIPQLCRRVSEGMEYVQDRSEEIASAVENLEAAWLQRQAEEEAEASQARVDAGIGQILLAAGAITVGGVAIYVSAGWATPFVIGIVSGALSVNYGISSGVEGLQNVCYGLNGNLTRAAFNPIRDTYFFGNQSAYDAWGRTSMTVAGICSFYVGLVNMAAGAGTTVLSPQVLMRAVGGEAVDLGIELGAEGVANVIGDQMGYNQYQRDLLCALLSTAGSWEADGLDSLVRHQRGGVSNTYAGLADADVAGRPFSDPLDMGQSGFSQPDGSPYIGQRVPEVQLRGMGEIDVPTSRMVDGVGNGIEGGLDAKIKPSNPYNVDVKPNGTVTKITDKMDEATRRSLIRENEAAEAIAQNGYNIEQNPVIDGTTRNPDYLIEGEIFDCYSPAENTKVRNVASTIEEKVVKKGQAERVVLNLDDWKGNVDELVKQLNDYPIEGLKEVIIVYDGTVQSIYP